MTYVINRKVKLSLLMLGSLATVTTNISAVELLAVKDTATKISTPAIKAISEKASSLLASATETATKYWDQFAAWATPASKDVSQAITQAWKKGQAPLQEKIVDIVKDEYAHIKKGLPKYLRDAFYGAIALYIVKKSVEYLIEKPWESAKNKLNYAKKVFYVAQAQELLKDENVLENIMKKVFQMGLTLNIPEQIAILGLYLMDDQELTTKQLMEEETVDKIVSGEVSLDKSQLKKLIQSIIKQNKKASDDEEADKDQDKDDEDTENKAKATSKTTRKKVSAEDNAEANKDKDSKPNTVSNSENPAPAAA